MCAGTYREQVVISKPLSLLGEHAVINEAGSPAFKITVPGLGTRTIYAAVVIVSSRVAISGFRVTNVTGEGIIAAGLGGTIYGLDISGNAVVHNDLGGPKLSDDLGPTHNNLISNNTVTGNHSGVREPLT